MLTEKTHVAQGGFLTPSACGSKHQLGLRICPWERRNEVTCLRCKKIIKKRLKIMSYTKLMLENARRELKIIDGKIEKIINEKVWSDSNLQELKTLLLNVVKYRLEGKGHE